MKYILAGRLFFACTFPFSFAFAAPSHITHVKGYTLDNTGQLITFTNMVFDGGKGACYWW
jgi:hypothetical protein